MALHHEQQLLSYAELQMEKSHSSHITVMVQQVLEYAGVSLSGVAAVAVSGGPGSYTGLRIGSGTAKGLCYSLDIPLISVDTLSAMAQQVISMTPSPERFLFCPMLDARRAEVYASLLTHDLQVRQEVAPVILDEASFASILETEQIIVFGNGSDKAQQLMGPHPNAFYVSHVHPSAKAIGALAWEKFQTQQLEDVAYFEPFYLKEVYITKPTGN